MIESFIENAGQKGFLMKMKASYDHRYKVIDLEDLSMNELSEFHNLLSNYIRSMEKAPGSDKVRAEILTGLSDRLKIYMRKRQMH